MNPTSRDLLDMLQSPGWKVVDEYIRRRTETLVNRLRHEKFQDLSEVARVQGECDAYRNLYGYIRQIEREIEKGAKQ